MFSLFPDEYTTFVMIVCFDCVKVKVFEGDRLCHKKKTQIAWDSLTTLLPYQISSDINNIYKQQQTKEVLKACVNKEI